MKQVKDETVHHILIVRDKGQIYFSQKLFPLNKTNEVTCTPLAV